MGRRNIDIKSQRQKLGLSQAETAAMLGISRSALSMAERGERKIPMDVIRALYRLDEISDSYISTIQNADLGSYLPKDQASMRLAWKSISNSKKLLKSLEKEYTAMKAANFHLKVLEDFYQRTNLVVDSGVDARKRLAKLKELQFAKINQRNVHCSASLLLTLSIRITSLKAEINLLKAYTGAEINPMNTSIKRKTPVKP